jgi:hypothetical protein
VSQSAGSLVSAGAWCLCTHFDRARRQLPKRVAFGTGAETDNMDKDKDNVDTISTVRSRCVWFRDGNGYPKSDGFLPY